LMTRVFLLSLSCNDLATPYLYTLSLHDALPIFLFVFAASIMGIVTYAFLSDPLLVLALILLSFVIAFALGGAATAAFWPAGREQDRKSTRLNSSHVKISYAVFCLKKKNNLYYFT